MAASALQIPELALETAEAKSLAEATANVAAYYPISIDPKTMAWVNLLMIAGAIYGSRGIAIYARVNRERRNPGHVLNDAKSDNIVRGAFDPMQVQAGRMPP